MRTSSIPALILALGIGFSGFFLSQAIKESRQYQRVVQVKGLSEKTVKANIAIWSLQFKNSNNDLSQLYSDVETAQDKLVKYLLNQGFNKSELSLNPVTVVDNRSNSYNTNNNIKQYTASAGITITTPKVDLVQSSTQKTAKLVESGIVLTHSLARFQFTELNQIKPLMLDDATSNAKSAAAAFAKNSNSTLGQIKNARQGVFTIRDANSQYNDGTSIYKVVRIVTTIDYYLQA